MEEFFCDDSVRRHHCCLTGHRQLPNSEKEREKLKNNLRKAIAYLVKREVTIFYTGGAQGFDTLAAMTVLEMKALFPEIRLHLVLPCPNQTQEWKPEEIALYEQIREHADEVSIISPDYTDDCMKKRNYYMVDHSCACVYYLTKTVRSGTMQTVNYARKKGCRMIDLLKEQGDDLFAQQLEVHLTRWTENVFVHESTLIEDK